MTDEYTPTDSDVREDFAYPWEGHPVDREGRLAAFDRWLAAHDAELAPKLTEEQVNQLLFKYNYDDTFTVAEFTAELRLLIERKS